MDRARVAWRSATLAVVLTIVGVPMDIVVGRAIGGVPVLPVLVAVAAAMLLLAFLLAHRGRPSRLLGNAIFLLDAAIILAVLWRSNEAYAESARAVIPFQAQKLGMVTVALLAPELWVGVLGIAAYAGSTIVQMSTFDELVRSRVSVTEPGATLVFAVFSAVLLAHRLRRLALEREVARAHAEVATAQKFARVVLAVRDLSNTPLQTIAFAAAMARTRHPDLEPILDLVDRSLARLRELDGRLQERERAVEWSSGEGSFDPLDVVKRGWSAQSPERQRGAR
jgi:hypothetical protein